ncbi:dephospho-CoA kinase [Priestia abyssalis]|uniref:dephospho-CoA kinase n=1 Tax=Priestia abyssalis TaxID=1221450 RepID=UPI0009955764|nr:dephospho-CoA kinase [Priestia abyssalis]
MALIIGLTGGIASGKSTVSGMLKELAIPVIDADVIAKEVVQKDRPAYRDIVRTFGTDILAEDLQLDRPKLGAIVFQDEEKRQLLNQIVHPAVRKAMLAQKEFFLQEGYETVVLDIPLLFESKLTSLVDKVLLVFVDDSIQLERLMARNNFTKEEAEARIRSQMPLQEKVPLADEVISNNGTIEETKGQLLDVLSKWNVVVEDSC